MFKNFLRILAVLYFIAFIFHFLDLFDLRLSFSKMDELQKVWIVYLFLFDLIASIGLWFQKKWGELLFMFIAVSQIVVYGFFREFLGPQTFLIWFHLITLLFYFLLKFRYKYH